MNTPAHLEKAVLAVLAGTTVEHAAETAAMPAGDLTSAVERYKTAGKAALAFHLRNPPWRHITVIMHGRDQAERIGIQHLAPLLESHRAAGELTGWWFLRKPEGWRLRYLPSNTATAVQTDLEEAMDHLQVQGFIDGWISGIYEPEIEAFGGPAAMDIAHELFSTDSRCLLHYLSQRHHHEPAKGPGRRELMLILPTVLARAAGLDWMEQGAIWADVAETRPTEMAQSRLHILANAAKKLLSADFSPSGALIHGTFAHIRESIAAYHHAGRALCELASKGRLRRGLRSVCARHLIFTANRLGIPYQQQSQLIAAAKSVILGS